MKWCPSVTKQREGPIDTVASIRLYAKTCFNIHLHSFYDEITFLKQFDKNALDINAHGVYTTRHKRRSRWHAVWSSVSATCLLLLTVSHFEDACVVFSRGSICDDNFNPIRQPIIIILLVYKGSSI